MHILAIETSCDETSAAIVKDGRQVLSSVIASQIDIHAKYGGVVPEIASRQHVIYITSVLQEALETARLGWNDIDAVAVTNGPGLAGALLVGVNAGKAIAFARQKPLVGVNHLESHIYANWLLPEGITLAELPEPEFPLVTLIVSGGHTEIVLMTGHGDYTLLGKTQDDAAGEAFDKVARVMGLGYPGGPKVEKAALAGNPAAYPFARAWLKGTYDFSFSGLKTNVLRKIAQYRPMPAKPVAFHGESEPVMSTVLPGTVAMPPDMPIADISASFQQAVVEVLATKTAQAAAEFKATRILIAGGVAANQALRQAIAHQAETLGISASFPPMYYCTDNAAMVAGAAYYKLTQSNLNSSVVAGGLSLDIYPGWELISR